MIERIAIIVALITFGWAALKDVESRRVKNIVWLPAITIGALLLIARIAMVIGEPRATQLLLLLRVSISLGFIIPLAYGFWYFGLFGGADARALIVMAVLLPKYPEEALVIAGTDLPLITPSVGVFSLSALTNGLLLTAAYPLWLFGRNLVSGASLSLWAFVSITVPIDDLPTTHGKLVETTEGMTLNGLDLDALRMYLNWRGITLADLRANPDAYRTSLPLDHGPTGDGRVVADGGRHAPDPETATTVPTVDDPWGAETFLADHHAYGTTPAQLRDALDLLTTTDDVRVTPGIPLIVSFFAGLVSAVVIGDLLAILISAI